MKMLLLLNGILAYCLCWISASWAETSGSEEAAKRANACGWAAYIILVLSVGCFAVTGWI